MSLKSELNEEFAEDLRQWMPPEKEYLVAVSGGRDSMALLHFLHESGFRQLVVCHVNHCLRGEASDGDEAFVREQTGRLGLPVESTRIDVQAVATENRLSLETAARNVRYEWFAEVAERRSCARIILAHHSDDQVETVLINLFRGTGSRGLSGMSKRSSRTVESGTGSCLRLRRYLDAMCE